MLEAAVIVMTVMGCGDQGDNCDFISESPQVWASVAECDLAIPGVLLSVKDASYPVLTAGCEAKVTNPAPQQETVIAQIDPEFYSGPSVPHANSAGTTIEILQSEAHEPKGEIGVIDRLENGYTLVRDGTKNVVYRISDRAVGKFSSLRDTVKNSTSAVTERVGQAAGKLRDGIGLGD